VSSVTGTGPEAVKAVSPEYTAPELLSDVPILDPAQDRLGFNAYAEALAELIDSPSVSTPLTMSINAPWGAGKTSLARLVERLVCIWPQDRGESPHLVVWFNAWMHGDAPNLGTALAAVVGKTAAEHRPAWRRSVQWLPSSMLSPEARRRRRVLVLLVAGVLALVVAYLPHALKLSGVSNETARWAGLGVLAAVPLAAGILASVLGVAQSAASFVRDPGAQAATGSMGEVGHQFAKLVRAATRGRRRLVIFIDDLDRCSPDRALQVCETASLLLAVPGVVTVLLGDLTALRTYAAEHLASGDTAAGRAGVLGNRSALDRYARSFLDKIVQLDFALPPSGGRALATVLESSAAASETPEARPVGRRTGRGGLGRVQRALTWLYEHICGRPRRYFAFVGITTGILIVLVIILASIDPNLNNNNKTDWEEVLGIIWTLLTITAWWVAGVGTFIQSLRRRRARKRTAQIDDTIRTTTPGPDKASDETIKDVVAQSVTEASARLIDQRVRRASVERLVREGNVELLDYLPDVPRAVKRVANRHYLLSSVAVSRKMLGGTPELTPSHLAKWALIMERWPEVASEIIRDPAAAAKLEQASEASSNGATGAPLVPLQDASEIPEFDELVRLLHDPVRIGSVAERLVFALPAT